MLPHQAALAEYMCGSGFLLSQLTASRKTARNDMRAFKATGNGHSPPLHADHSWMPSPYPEHNLFLTTCFVTDDGYETAEGGATSIVPRTHLLRRAPPTGDKELMDLAYKSLHPILAKKGSFVCWDGNIWHAGGFRKQAEGERIVVHTTFCRLYVRPVENYKFTVPDVVLKRNPPLLRAICGHRDFLDHTTNVDGIKLMKTYGMALAGRDSMAGLLGSNVPWKSQGSKL